MNLIQFLFFIIYVCLFSRQEDNSSQRQIRFLLLLNNPSD